MASSLMLPLSLLLRELAFRAPDQVESLYGRSVYPGIAWLMGRLNSLAPFTLAESGLALVVLCGSAYFLLAIRRQRQRGLSGLGGFLLRGCLTLWVAAGWLSFFFLVLWGLNYARPGLAIQMNLSVGSIQAEELLAAARRGATRASSLHHSLGLPSDRPTRLPLSFAHLNAAIDVRLRELGLPGDRIDRPTSPAKRLFLSPALSYLGLSGIFVPFTGEPCVNSLLPDCAIPMVVAHEKAHQRGITHEGEANLAAFLACSRAADFPYLRYAAYLYAASELIGTASIYRREEAIAAKKLLGPGPLRDIQALSEFWALYQGPVATAAEKVNDTYLKSFKVPEGAESYNRVVHLLIALDRRGEL